jgi:phytanoyl-CoA hydroxylase
MTVISAQARIPARDRYPIAAPDGSALQIDSSVPHDDPYRELRTPEQLRRYYDDQGYVVVRGLVPAELCDRAREAFQREVKPFGGYIYRQTTANPERHVLTEHGFMMNPILNVQDLPGTFPQFKSTALAIITHPRVQEAARALLGETSRIVQSMYFDGNPATWPHQDTYYLDSSTIGRMAAAWIAVEDIHPGAGRFFVYPGSHKIDVLKNSGGIDVAFHHDRYKKLIIDVIREHKLRCHAPALAKGDGLFWAAKTIHGSLQTVAPEHSRSSFTAHFIPASTALLQFQSRLKPLRLQRINGVEVHCPKDQERAFNRAMLWTETTFPRAFQLAKKIAIKLHTR